MDDKATQTLLRELMSLRANDRSNQIMTRTLYDRMTALENTVNNMAAIQQIGTETLIKTANSTNVIIRVLAGAIDMSEEQLSQILTEAGAHTSPVKPISGIQFEENPMNLLDYPTDRLKVIISHLLTMVSNLNDAVNNSPSTTSSQTITLSNTSQTYPVQPSTISNVLSQPTTSAVQPSTHTAVPDFLSQSSSSFIPQTYAFRSNLTNESICKTQEINLTSNMTPSVFLKETRSSITQDQNSGVLMDTTEETILDKNLSTETNGEKNPIVTAQPSMFINESTDFEVRENLRKKYRNKYRYVESYKNSRSLLSGLKPKISGEMVGAKQDSREESLSANGDEIGESLSAIRVGREESLSANGDEIGESLSAIRVGREKSLGGVNREGREESLGANRDGREESLSADQIRELYPEDVQVVIKRFDAEMPLPKILPMFIKHFGSTSNTQKKKVGRPKKTNGSLQAKISLKPKSLHTTPKRKKQT